MKTRKSHPHPSANATQMAGLHSFTTKFRRYAKCTKFPGIQLLEHATTEVVTQYLQVPHNDIKLGAQKISWESSIEVN